MGYYSLKKYKLTANKYLLRFSRCGPSDRRTKGTDILKERNQFDICEKSRHAPIFFVSKTVTSQIEGSTSASAYHNFLNESPGIEPGYIVFPSHKNNVQILDFIGRTAIDEKKRNF
jgi:hypothetical protein